MATRRQPRTHGRAVVNDSSAVASAESCVVVARWLEAVNVRDLDGALRCLDPRVELRLLNRSGTVSSHRGHRGVRSWFEQREQGRHDYFVRLHGLRAFGDSRVLATGKLVVPSRSDLSSFCALYRLTGALIVAAHQYVRPPDARMPAWSAGSIDGAPVSGLADGLSGRLAEVLERSADLAELHARRADRDGLSSRAALERERARRAREAARRVCAAGSGSASHGGGTGELTIRDA